jgi:arylsulfatase A-like enzyme
MDKKRAQRNNGKDSNILVIYPDQMRADAMGCVRNPCVKTPHFDRLAMEGVRFENAFVSFPLCTPFRASLFTGKYNHAVGAHANHHPIPLGHDFLPEIMRDSGYRTGYIGKWHLEGGDKPGYVPPGPRRLGFEHMVGFNRGHFYLNSIYFRDTDQPYHCPRYEPDFQTDHLIQFMESSVNHPDGKPFFAFICYGAPHFPFNMPEYYRNLYSPEEVPLPPTAADPESQREVLRMLSEGNFPLVSGVWGKEKSAPEALETEAEVRQFIALYYGMIANVDHNVGIILNWLDKKDLTEDTLVILLSDHGDMTGENGYRCRTKKNPHRGAMQVPLICRYPKRFPAGHRVASLVDVSVDTMPTLLDFCGIKIPNVVHGRSFLSLLEGGSSPTRDEVFYEVIMEKEGPERFPTPERGIRTLDWLYCRTPDGPKWLYDLKEDPLETKNFVNDESYRQVQESLDRLVIEYMQRTDDDWAIEAKFPPPGFLMHEEADEKIEALLESQISATRFSDA